jgi:putative oxidoreductase
MRKDDWTGFIRSLLRIVVGLLFSMHGWQKLFGIFGMHAVRPVGSLLWVAGVLETFGGALIVLGLFTRPVAFLLCGEMAVAYFHHHFPQGLWPIQNGGELAILYCFFYLYLCAAGPGPVSLDRLLRRK